MKIAQLLNLCEAVTVYRGVTKNNLARRYPGTYYTENPELAKRYAKQEGTVHSKVLNPVKTLVIDDIIYNTKFRKELGVEFTRFMNANYPDVDITDTQLYDNLTSDITDFSYPTKYDNHFLKNLGYDTVKFTYEGGEKVDSWYVLD